ncbi:MAG: T9SS type A sorting domain-containing protein [Saprospiraceae bacterium]
MKKSLLLSLLFLFIFQNNLFAQLILDADGSGDTYELITSKLAPGYNPIEVPDCGHTLFGRHIDEVFDADLNDDVFRFSIHVNDDNDRCINFDRQRNEIKTYDKSPDSLLGISGEIVEYKWKFKLDTGHQSSSNFTHIHQLKAVGGTESSKPLITLTTRKGTPDKLELRYAETTTQVTLSEVDLTPFKGTWCEAIETVTYGESGAYNIVIRKVSDNTVLFSYTDNDIRMWKTEAEFVRPKWGIYRSLINAGDLRDEEVLFANFSIEEILTAPLPVELISFDGFASEDFILLNWQTASEQNNQGFQIQKTTDHINWDSIGYLQGVGNSNIINQYNFEDTRPLDGINYYRLKQIDFDGNYQYSDIASIDFKNTTSDVRLYPNPTNDLIQILGINKSLFFEIFNSLGEKVLEGNTNNNQISLSSLPNAIYFINLHLENELLTKRVVKK